MACLTHHSENYQVICFLEGSLPSDPGAMSFPVQHWLHGWQRKGQFLLNLQHLRSFIISKGSSCVSITTPSPFKYCSLISAVQHRCSVLAHGLGQHKPFSLAPWRKMLECLLQKNKHWLMLGNVTCEMRYFARPPWLHCLTLISHMHTGWQQLKINSSKLFMPGGSDFQAEACGLDYGILPHPQGKCSGKSQRAKRVRIACTFVK